SARYAKVKALHIALISPLEPEVARVFVDTKLTPVMLDGKTYQPPGPLHPLARLRWLADPQSKVWVPTAREAVDAYMAWRSAASQPARQQPPVSSRLRVS